MTGIKIVCVGRVKEDFFRDGIAAYVKEIRKKYSMDIMECPDEPTPDQCPASVERQIREMEGERILSKIKDDDYVIALCIDGKHYSTSAWKKRMERVFSTVSSDVVFVIGGSLGLADKCSTDGQRKAEFFSIDHFLHQMMASYFMRADCPNCVNTVPTNAANILQKVFFKHFLEKSDTK